MLQGFFWNDTSLGILNVLLNGTVVIGLGVAGQQLLNSLIVGASHLFCSSLVIAGKSMNQCSFEWTYREFATASSSFRDMEIGFFTRAVENAHEHVVSLFHDTWLEPAEPSAACTIARTYRIGVLRTLVSQP